MGPVLTVFILYQDPFFFQPIFDYVFVVVNCVKKVLRRNFTFYTTIKAFIKYNCKIIKVTSVANISMY